MISGWAIASSTSTSEPACLVSYHTFGRSLSGDRSITAKVSGREIERLLDARVRVGDAAGRCDSFLWGQADPVLAGYGGKPRGRKTEY
jgi:hypothetical protein